jgi:hypothetical protein
VLACVVETFEKCRHLPGSITLRSH